MCYTLILFFSLMCASSFRQSHGFLSPKITTLPKELLLLNKQCNGNFWKMLTVEISRALKLPKEIKQRAEIEGNYGFKYKLPATTEFKSIFADGLARQSVDPPAIFAGKKIGSEKEENSKITETTSVKVDDHTTDSWEEDDSAEKEKKTKKFVAMDNDYFNFACIPKAKLKQINSDIDEIVELRNKANNLESSLLLSVVTPKKGMKLKQMVDVIRQKANLPVKKKLQNKIVLDHVLSTTLVDRDDSNDVKILRTIYNIRLDAKFRTSQLVNTLLDIIPDCRIGVMEHYVKQMTEDNEL